MYWGFEGLALSLALIVLTTAVHTMGVVLMGLAGLRLRDRLSTWKLDLRQGLLIVMAVIGSVGLLLAILHAIEYAIWAAAYFWIGATDTPMDAMLYSIDSMTTRGASGLRLESHWRTMGALEAGDGMILFGISTAFIFTVMQGFWPLLQTWRR